MSEEPRPDVAGDWFAAMRRGDWEAAWRATTREAFLDYLERGYTVVAFHRGDGRELPFYELARPAGMEPTA